MKAKEFIPASKPRNFVAKNQKTAGAGAHKDKKRADKQGDVKHKQKQFEQGVAEGVSYGTMGAKATQQLLAAFKDASHGVEHFSNDQEAVKGIYDALKDTATEQKVLPQLKSLLDSANHYARQEFDTNPGDFKNWWQFVGQLLEGLVKNYKEKGELEDEPDFELDTTESAPKGWEGTVKAMKKHKDIDNPWALAHYMKNKGSKSHKKEQVAEKKKYPFAGAKVGQKEGPAGQLRTGPARAGKLVGGS